MLPVLAGLAFSLLPASPRSPQEPAVALHEPHQGELSRTEFAFHELGLRVLDLRWLGVDGRVERQGVTEDGRWVDVDELRRKNHALEIARLGKIDATLRARLAQAAPGEQIEVAFWLLEPADGFDPARGIRAAASGLARAAALEQNATRLAPRVEAPGWMGTLGAAGLGTGVLPIPPLPEIAGLEVHFGMALWDRGVSLATAPISVSHPAHWTIVP
jgi:hypothetical protein